MSQDRPRGPDVHLDDEALSAALDGDRTRDVDAHLASCSTCAARLGELRAVAAAVAAPVPPPPTGAREAAVARAIGEVVDLGRARASRRPSRRWISLGAVAAVVLALLVAVPLLDRDGGRGEDAALETGGRDLDAAAPARSLDDLGPLDADEQLRAVVARRLSIAADESGAGGAGGEAGEAHTRSGSTAPTAGALQSSPRSVPALADESFRSCVAELGSEVPPGDVLADQALLTWKDTPALALVYRSDGRASVYVVARDDCRILTFQRIATPTP